MWWIASVAAAMLVTMGIGCTHQDIDYVRTRLSQIVSPAREQYLEARGFVVRDQEGHIRINLGVGDDGTPVISLNGADGEPRAIIGAAPNNGPASIALIDHNHGARLVLQLDGDGFPNLRLLDENATPRATLTYDGKGPRLRVSGANGQGRVVLGVFPATADDKGSTAGLLIANEMGVPMHFTTVAGDAMPDLSKKRKKAK